MGHSMGMGSSGVVDPGDTILPESGMMELTHGGQTSTKQYFCTMCNPPKVRDRKASD